jgi:predicted Zn-dependent protease
MREPLRINLALLLVGDDNRGAVAESLWTMFGELSALWNTEGELVQFASFYAGTEPARGIVERSENRHLIPVPADAIDEMLATTRGTYASTIDQDALAKRMRALVDRHGALGEELLLVTDRELTPPRGWRYILWQRTESAWVVSTAPMDPDYWGIEDPQRVRKIKQRARAACMIAVGLALGLERCENPQCFMFERVDSVTRLDVMRGIGDEHKEFPAVESVGFSPVDVTDPREEQPLAKAADLKIEGWPKL